MSRRLIVGLGNPGDEYAKTRHNIGFMVVDAVAAGFSLDLGPPKGSRSAIGRWLKSPRLYDAGEAAYRGRRLVVMKPQTFMNRSGEAVSRALKRYDVDLRDVLVIYDDISLPLGAVRLREKGGAGGHNGLQDIIEALNSDNLPRMRVGIGDTFQAGRQTDYVLSPFDASELPTVGETVRFARDAALAFVVDGIATAMNRFNRKHSPTSEPE